MEKNKWNEIQAIVLFAAALLILISIATFSFSDVGLFTSKINNPVRNLAGVFGAYLGTALLFVMGLSAYVIPLLVASWAFARLYGITPQKIHFKIFGTLCLISASSSLFAIIARGDNELKFKFGGAIGLVFSDFLVKYLGWLGAVIIIGVLFLLSVLLATEFLLLPFLSGMIENAKTAVGWVKESRPIKKQGPPVFTVKKAKIKTVDAGTTLLKKTENSSINKTADEEELLPVKKAPKPAVSTYVPQKSGTQPPLKESLVVKTAKDGYTLPGLDLLDTPPALENRKIQEDFNTNINILEETLRDFDIEAKVVEVNQGPVITRYELEPAAGVKIQRVTALTDNIALAMKAQSVRIVAPIPGKGTIGVEVPNSVNALVYLREVLDSNEYRQSKSKLKLALGKDIAGVPVLADLTSMPHLLIAGATGSGKTVCINALITTLLCNSTPDELKFIMIDPKRVELAAFNDLPHLLSPVVTDSKKVAGVLDWVVNEMDSRYELFAKSGVRNIDLYNEKIGKTEDIKLPYIIVIIDELADLMMVAQADIEAAITRLAQLSRAVGIHIVLATQRPSVDVITGVIKANFPARISFKVASKVDSRTVLDINGADKLLGRGDMLFIEPGASRPVRAQCSLISDKEIERVTSFIKSQRQPEYVTEIVDIQKKQTFKKFEKDEVYEEAVRMVLESRQASVSILQRRLGVGYTRAARLIDMMEDEGIVGPYQGSKPRDILVTAEEYNSRDTAKSAENS